MVPTTAFSAVAVATASNVPAKSFATDTDRIVATPAAVQLQFDDVRVNGVPARSVTELLELGAARHDCAADSAPKDAAAAFTAHAPFENDVAYFKALLAGRNEIKHQLEQKLKALRLLRAKNNSIYRKRKARKGRKAGSPAAARASVRTCERAAAAGPGPVAPTRPSTLTPNGSIAAVGSLITTSNVTGESVVHVPGTWHAGHRGEVCSSLLSTEEHGEENRAKDIGRCADQQRGRGMQGAMYGGNDISYSA